MAVNRASFVPSFVEQAMTFGVKRPVHVAFDTTRAGADRISTSVKIDAMHFDHKTKSIKVFCSDGNLRECRVERLPSLEIGRALWRQLADIGNAGMEVQFKAAGGFSPDKWFYAVEA
jgi:methylaspartate ammonia-lyase